MQWCVWVCGRVGVRLDKRRGRGAHCGAVGKLHALAVTAILSAVCAASSWTPHRGGFAPTSGSSSPSRACCSQSAGPQSAPLAAPAAPPAPLLPSPAVRSTAGTSLRWMRRLSSAYTSSRSFQGAKPRLRCGRASWGGVVGKQLRRGRRSWHSGWAPAMAARGCQPLCCFRAGRSSRATMAPGPTAQPAWTTPPCSPSHLRQGLPWPSTRINSCPLRGSHTKMAWSESEEAARREDEAFQAQYWDPAAAGGAAWAGTVSAGHTGWRGSTPPGQARLTNR